MSTTPGPSDATVDRCLRLGHGFHESERPKVVDGLARLDHHLVGQPAEAVHVDLQVKERDSNSQKLTAEVHVAGLPTLVATAKDPDVWVAVAHARDELIRQFEDVRSRREPHHRS